MGSMGRVLAVCGWVAWQTRRIFDGTRLSGASTRLAPVLAVALLLLAVVPIVPPFFVPQPDDVTVQEIFDGKVTRSDGWVRLSGRLTPLQVSPTGLDGTYGLLVDAVNPLRAIVVESSDELEPQESAHADRDAHAARRAPGRRAANRSDGRRDAAACRPGSGGGARRDAGAGPLRAMAARDPADSPGRESCWLAPASGYPIFRPASDIDVLASPLSPGERIPSAYGGRIGDNRADLAEPAGVLLLVRRGTSGNLLTAQPLTEGGGPAPSPVTIGGSWTNGVIGTVLTVRETVAALHVRSELVDAIFLFARMAERDRVAALVAVDR